MGNREVVDRSYIQMLSGQVDNKDVNIRSSISNRGDVA